MKLLVVNYHYYRNETYKSGIYPTSKKQLFKQVDAIRNNDFEFASLSEITETLSIIVRLRKDYVLLLLMMD